MLPNASVLCFFLHISTSIYSQLVRVAIGIGEAVWFSSTSSTEESYIQHIRERFLPPFSSGFWDGVSFLFIFGLCAYKRPERRLNAGLGQVDANTTLLLGKVRLALKN
jgi:hypothetical protein